MLCCLLEVSSSLHTLSSHLRLKSKLRPRDHERFFSTRAVNNHSCLRSLVYTLQCVSHPLDLWVNSCSGHHETHHCFWAQNTQTNHFSILCAPTSLGYLMLVNPQLQNPFLVLCETTFFWVFSYSAAFFSFSFGFSSSAHILGVSVSLTCFSLYINPTLPLIASASASVQMIHQTRHLWWAPFWGLAPHFCLPTKHFPPAHPLAFKLIMTHIEMLTTTPFQTFLPWDWS